MEPEEKLPMISLLLVFSASRQGLDSMKMTIELIMQSFLTDQSIASTSFNELSP
jgi:hypothetical protein